MPHSPPCCQGLPRRPCAVSRLETGSDGEGVPPGAVGSPGAAGSPLPGAGSAPFSPSHRGAGGSAEHGGAGAEEEEEEGPLPAAGLTSAGGGALPVSFLGSVHHFPPLPYSGAGAAAAPASASAAGGSVRFAGSPALHGGSARRGQPGLRRPPALFEVRGAPGWGEREPGPGGEPGRGAAPVGRAPRRGGWAAVGFAGRERSSVGSEKLLHAWGGGGGTR